MNGDDVPVLVVEHDPVIGRPLVDQLVADGYPARLARTAEHARMLAQSRAPELAVLCDLGSCRAALDLLAEMRGGEHPWPTGLPVIVVSSEAAEPDLLRAFETGADDFITRPASYLELRARLGALLRRADPCRSVSCIEIGQLRIDQRARAVSLSGSPVHLRRLEYDLLLCLARDPGRVFTKWELMNAVWCYASQGCTRTLDSHASRIRCKLAAAGGEQWIVNVWGIGYRLT